MAASFSQVKLNLNICLRLSLVLCVGTLKALDKWRSGRGVIWAMLLGCEWRGRPKVLTPNISTAVQNPQTTNTSPCVSAESLAVQGSAAMFGLKEGKYSCRVWNKYNVPLRNVQIFGTKSESQKPDDKRACSKMKGKKHERLNENKALEMILGEMKSLKWQRAERGEGWEDTKCVNVGLAIKICYSERQITCRVIDTN